MNQSKILELRLKYIAQLKKGVPLKQVLADYNKELLKILLS